VRRFARYLLVIAFVAFKACAAIRATRLEATFS
jgi:hypothetical protein